MDEVDLGVVLDSQGDYEVDWRGEIPAGLKTDRYHMWGSVIQPMNSV